MYKCDDCGLVFEIPKEYVEPEQIYEGCPNCRGTFTQAFKCRICDEWKPHYRIVDDICCDCARKAYTHRLGLKFVDSHKDFYLWRFSIAGFDRDLKSDLVEILENDFLSKIDMDTDWNHELKDLKEYCLDDMETWIEFLKEEI